MATVVLTVIGDDRAGLVSALSEVVARHHGNWERSQMAELAGKFAGIVLVTVPDQHLDALLAGFDPLRDQGLLDVTAAPAGVDDQPHGSRFELSLVGTDRPGIVREITRVLAEHGVSIDELNTATREAPMSGGTLFEADAVLVAPVGVATVELRAALERLADELMVEVTLSDV
jgi:glycine cleavage system regulatory protein